MANISDAELYNSLVARANAARDEGNLKMADHWDTLALGLVGCDTLETPNDE